MKKSLILLCGIILLGVCGCNRRIETKRLQRLEEKINGKWESTTSVDGVKKNIKFENAFVGCGGDATPCIHRNSQLMTKTSVIFEEYSGDEFYVCFELENDNELIQANCKDDEEIEYSKYNYVKEMGIKYKKIS